MQLNLSHTERPELGSLMLSVAPQRSVKMRNISRSTDIAQVIIHPSDYFCKDEESITELGHS